MATVKISTESLSLLIPEARKLEISVKDLLDTIIAVYFGELEEGPEEEGEEEEGEEEEEPEEEE